MVRWKQEQHPLHTGVRQIRLIHQTTMSLGWRVSHPYLALPSADVQRGQLALHRSMRDDEKTSGNDDFNQRDADENARPRTHGPPVSTLM